MAPILCGLSLRHSKSPQSNPSLSTGLFSWSASPLAAFPALCYRSVGWPTLDPAKIQSQRVNQTGWHVPFAINSVRNSVQSEGGDNMSKGELLSGVKAL